MFLKTCDFDIQILVQSKKENLSKAILNIQTALSAEKNSKIREISEKYIEFVKRKNNENKSSSKNFYIVIKFDMQNFNNIETVAKNNLSENFFKIKESLSRCGNQVLEINSKEEIKRILISFYNPRISQKYE